MEEEKKEVLVGEVVEEKPSRQRNPNWKPGMKSPNPNGRPKKEFSLTKLTEDLMKTKRAGDITAAQAILQRLYEIAMGTEKGAKVADSLKAIEMLNDRWAGKPKTFLEISNDIAFDVNWGDDDKQQIDWGDTAGELEAGDEEDSAESQSQETPA